MKTLAEHNAQRTAEHERGIDARQPHPNGIECPKCGAELSDSSPGVALLSSPPQKHVHCPACQYKGYALR